LNKALARVIKKEDCSFTLTFHDGSVAIADRLVLAIPCSVYEKITFDERAIPTARLKAIQQVRYGTNAKIIVPLSVPSSRTCSLVSDQMMSFMAPSQSFLTIYYTGEAGRFSRQTIHDAYVSARPMLEAGLRENCPSFMPPCLALDASFVDYSAPVGYSWPNDPYAKGSYSFIESGQEALLTTLVEEKGEKYKTLFSPVNDCLYFAGEHASILLDVPGTMEAACESGERTVRAILQSVNFYTKS
jgi:monoamine oxidase